MKRFGRIFPGIAITILGLCLVVIGHLLVCTPIYEASKWGVILTVITGCCMVPAGYMTIVVEWSGR